MSDSTDRVRQRAAAFVARRGDALARRTAEALVGGDPAGLEAWLSEVQRPDGGFPPDASIQSARRAVGALLDVAVCESPTLGRACRFLEERQADCGGWRVGEEETSIRETGLLAGLLARSPFARADALDSAADWLAARFSPERVQGFAWDAIAAYGACFANILHDESDAILQWCGRELQRGFQAKRFDAVRTGRVLAWCDAPSIPGGRLAAPLLVEAILAGQAVDGSWPAPDGVEPVEHVLDALAVLRRFA